MGRATGFVYCPKCGVEVKFGADVTDVRLEDGGLWIRLYDAKPRHKCRRGD